VEFHLGGDLLCSLSIRYYEMPEKERKM